MLAQLLALLVPPCCLTCRAPVAAGRPLCSACLRDVPWLAETAPLPGGNAVWAPTAFDGTARALVHALKFGGRTAVARVMAAQIAANAPRELFAGGVLVPAPANPARARQRGFDQATLLARALARRTRLPVRALLTRRRGATQVGAGRAVRISRDLGIAARGAVAGRIVLVDDVCTTGATLAACAAALRQAGAAEVACLVYSRTLG